MSAATPSAATAAIVLENVSYTYPGAERPVLRGVFLEIPRGQCVVVTGASGCGKTTLTRLINGLVPHVYAGEVKGRVMVEGTEVAAWTPDELGVRVGSVFQNPRSQFVNLDVASEIAFGCENLGLPRGEIVARVSKAARALGIADLLDRGIEELSGGQKQAVAIASAFAMEPAVFVLDEPTASLDVPSMKRLAEVVAALKAAARPSSCPSTACGGWRTWPIGWCSWKMAPLPATGRPPTSRRCRPPVAPRPACGPGRWRRWKGRAAPLRRSRPARSQPMPPRPKRPGCRPPA